MYDKLYYLMLACLVNSNETEDDICLMVERLFNYNYVYNSQKKLHYPCPVGDKTDVSVV